MSKAMKPKGTGNRMAALGVINQLARLDPAQMGSLSAEDAHQATLALLRLYPRAQTPLDALQCHMNALYRLMVTATTLPYAVSVTVGEFVRRSVIAMREAGLLTPDIIEDVVGGLALGFAGEEIRMVASERKEVDYVLDCECGRHTTITALHNGWLRIDHTLDIRLQGRGLNIRCLHCHKPLPWGADEQGKNWAAARLAADDQWQMSVKLWYN